MMNNETFYEELILILDLRHTIRSLQLQYWISTIHRHINAVSYSLPRLEFDDTGVIYKQINSLDDVNMLGENPQTNKENKEILLEESKGQIMLSSKACKYVVANISLYVGVTAAFQCIATDAKPLRLSINSRRNNTGHWIAQLDKRILAVVCNGTKAASTQFNIPIAYACNLGRIESSLKDHRKLIFFFLKLNIQTSYTNSVQKLQILEKYFGRNRRLVPILIELPDFRKRRRIWPPATEANLRRWFSTIRQSSKRFEPSYVFMRMKICTYFQIVHIPATTGVIVRIEFGRLRLKPTYDAGFQLFVIVKALRAKPRLHVHEELVKSLGAKSGL
ncbi:hypothetical protein ANN_26466 [Periplaneta americana]|uniref:Uncharacterized protein n=1 Tax=Periplaneta americana TaxID=6978 RepID=A0ABQ8RYA7_PERAM|nr:hypothetical protein ANN_26466 [Periplaneta americana]